MLNRAPILASIWAHRLALFTGTFTHTSSQVHSSPLTLTLWHTCTCMCLHASTLAHSVYSHVHLPACPVFTGLHTCVLAHLCSCTLDSNHSFPVCFRLLWLLHHFVFTLLPPFLLSSPLSSPTPRHVSDLVPFPLPLPPPITPHARALPVWSPLGWVQLAWDLCQRLPHGERCPCLPHCPCGCRLFHLPLDMKLKLHIKRIMHL